MANSKNVKDYDPTKPDNSLLYVDANNLHGWALAQVLPYKDPKKCQISRGMARGNIKFK